MKITKSRLKQIIKEEISLGFGQGKPPTGKLYKKQVIAMEEGSEEVMQAMQKAPEAAQKLADEVVAKVEALVEPIDGLSPEVILSQIAGLLTGGA